jgi:hypothetical protein
MLYEFVSPLFPNVKQISASERTEKSGNDFDLYSEGAQFKFRPGHQISCLKFSIIFFSPSKQILVYLLKSGSNCFLPHRIYLLVYGHPVSQSYSTVQWYSNCVPRNPGIPWVKFRVSASSSSNIDKHNFDNS